MATSPEETAHKFLCGNCNLKFSKQSNLTRHRRNVHQEVIAQGRTPQKCPLCSFTYLSRAAYARHLADRHGHVLAEERHEFASLGDFFEWKREIERRTVSSFVRNTAKKSTRDGLKTYYICCRKGFYRSEGKGRKLMKQQGSRKINSSCPAAITVLEKAAPNGPAVQVTYMSTHVGHENELAHLDLAKSEREMVAHQISLGISPDCILKNFRSSTAPFASDRVRLLKKRDIHNVARDFKLDIRKHELELSVVESWLGLLEPGVQNPLLCYKPVGIMDSQYEELCDNDFILGVMNDTQQALLSKHGRRLVCVDCAEGGTVRLVTVVVLDEEGGSSGCTGGRPRALPVALLVAGRLNRATLLTFFRCVRQRTGPIAPELFVSGGDLEMESGEDLKGDDEMFYRAWYEEMGVPRHRWMCGWRVAAAWESHLKGMSKDVARSARRKMEALVREPNRRTFESSFRKTLEDLSNCLITTEFARQVEARWSLLAGRWAQCYWPDALPGSAICAASAGLSLELVQKELRHRFAAGGRRSAALALDASLTGMMRYIHETLLGAAGQHCQHQTAVLERLQAAGVTRHGMLESKKGARLRVSRVGPQLDERQWLVQEQEGIDSNERQVYEVKCLVSGSVIDGDCKLSCTHCQACIHSFACTCLDYTLCFNLCVHIHAVATTFTSNPAPAPCAAPAPNVRSELCEAVDAIAYSPDAAATQVTMLLDSGEVVLVEKVEAVPEPAPEAAPADTAAYDEFCRVQQEVVTSMNDIIQECETVPQLVALRRMLETVRPALVALKEKVITPQREIKDGVADEELGNYVIVVEDDNVVGRQ